MKTCSILLFLIFQGCVFAQHQVVRDPIACAYGLKNTEKKWVVPAQYQEIQVNGNGVFFCKSGEKWGILNRFGKTFVETKYDQVYQIREDRFVLVTKKLQDDQNQTLMGVIDTNKNWVLPQVFSSIQQIFDEQFLVTKTTYAKNVEPKNQSAIYDVNGLELIPFINGIILYRKTEESVYLVGDKRVNNYTLAGNVRFVNKAGKNLSDSTFDIGMPCGDNFTVVKNNKFGLFNPEGKPIVWPRFQFERSNYESSNSIPCLHSNHQIIFTENNKKGIVNGSWKVITEPIYERITPINTQVNYPLARYYGYISETNRYDLIDLNGKKMIEVDTFLTKMIRLPTTKYYASDAYRTFYFFGIRKNKEFDWGILDEKAQILVPARNANIIITSNFEAILIEESNSKIPTVQRFLLTDPDTLKINQVNFKTQLDSIFIFQFESNFYPLIYDNSQKTWRQEMYGYNLPKSYGNLLLISGNMGGYIYNKTTNIAQKVKSIDLLNGGLPSVYTEEGMNLIHPNKGFLFKEFYTQINQQFKSINRIWVQNKVGKWKIFDTLGEPLTNILFDQISYEWGNNTIAKTNAKNGLLDENLKWIIKPLFAELFFYTKSLYVGITPTGKVAVIQLKKPTLIDTSYSSFFPLFSSEDGNTFFYSLEKNGESFCFDKESRLVNLTKKQLWLQNLPNIEVKFEDKPLLGYWKEAAYDFCSPTFQNQIQNSRNSVINGQRGSNYQENSYFKVEYISSKLLSLSITKPETIRLDYDYNQELQAPSGNFEVGNWMIKKDGTLKKIEFFDLVNTNSPAYRKAIIEEIEDNEFEIDCNQPEAIYSGVSQFSFHPKGIMLYFFEGQSQAFELILNKTQLATIPSAKWILEYLD